MKSVRRLTRAWLQVGFGTLLAVWYIADVAVDYRSAEAFFAQRLGIGTLGAKLFMAAPVVIFGVFAWYKLSREAHQSSTAPNNRWRGP